MALLLRPERWLTKPPAGTPLDPSHPLAAGLRLLIPFTEGAGAARDVVTGRLAYVPVANGTWGATAGRGVGLRTTAAGQSGNLAFDAQWAIAFPLTIWFYGAQRNATFADQSWFGVQTTGTTNGYGVYHASADSTDHAFLAGGGTFADISIGALASNRAYGIALTYDGANLRGWVDGVQKNSAARTGAVTYVSGSLQVGNEGDGASVNNGLADVLAFGVWNRVLSGAELQQLAATPYAMLRPRATAQRFFLPPPGGANPLGGTGSIVSGGTATLTQTQALAGSGTIVSGGTADLSTSGSNPLAGTGTITSGGTANLTQTQALAGSGAIVSGGSASLLVTKPLAGTGSIVSGGTANLTNSGGGSGTANFTIGVNNAGTGGNDFAPAAVRDSGNRLWRAANTSGTTDFTNNSGQYNNNTLRMFRADQDQVPSSFTEKDSAHRPTNIGDFSIAIDGADLIHVAYVSPYAAAVPGIYYVTFNTGTNLWGTPVKIGTANYAATFSYTPGDAGVAMALDANGAPHVVHYGQTSGTGATHIFYTNKTSGSWSAALQLDGATLGTNQQCMHPMCMFDSTGALHVAWMTITANYGTTLEKCYYVKRSSGGSFGSVQTFAENLLGSVDNGPSLYVSEDDRVHIAYGLGDGTAPLGQAVTGATVNNSVFYRFSADGGTTWNTTTQPAHYVSHDFSLGPDGFGGVRIYVHKQPTTVDGVGTAIGYMQLPKGGSWAAWTQIANDANGDGFDCTVSPRRAQFFHNRPAYLDTAYTDANLPASAMLSSDPTGNALVGQTQTGTVVSGGTATLSNGASNALAGTGSIVSGGSAALTQTQALSGTGSIVSGGSANLTQTQALAGTGSIVSGGSADLTNTPGGTKPLAGTGAVTSAGSANLTQVQVLAGAGAAVSGGAAALAVIVNLAAAGTIQSGGGAALAVTAPLGGTGGITSAGLALLRQTHVLAGAGAITSGGTATLGNGALVVLGTATLTDQAVTTSALTDQAVTTGALADALV